MAHTLTSFGIVVMLSFSLVAHGKRSKALDSRPESSDALEGAMCTAAIIHMSEKVFDRMGAYFGPACNFDHDMLEPLSPWREGSEPSADGYVNREGKEVICSSQCLNCPELSIPLLGEFSIEEILENCGSDPAFSVFQQYTDLIGALDSVRAACPPQDPVSMLGPVPSEPAGTAEDGELPPEPVVLPVTVAVPEPVPVPTRSRVEQQKLDLDFRGAFAVVATPDCEKMQNSFRVFDFRRTSRITMEDFDRVLNKVPEDIKSESRQLLEQLISEVGEDGSVGFKQLAHKKLSVRDALSCSLGYMTGA